MTETFSLITFAMIATISPGGATALATASGTRFGLQRSLPLLAGISVGLGGLMVAVGAGLGTVLLEHPTARLVLRVIGSMYLLWLAWTIMAQGAPQKRRSLERPLSFVTGVLLLWLNPKAWTLASAAVVAYSTLVGDPLRLGLVLGIVFLLASAVSTCLWCVVGHSLGRRLQTERAWRNANVVLGLLLVGSIVPLWL